MGSNLLFQLDSLEFEMTMRGWFGQIIRWLYTFISAIINLLFDTIAPNRFGLEEHISKISNSFFIILLIFMIFRLTITLLNYIIDPDSAFDKNIGFSKLITRVVIGIILLVSINPLFNFLYDLQSDILENNVIEQMIFGEETNGKIISDDGVMEYYAIKMSYLCPENRYVMTFNKGDAFAIQALKPFYKLTDPESIEENKLLGVNVDNLVKKGLEKEISKGAHGYCGVDFGTNKPGDDIEIPKKSALKEWISEKLSFASIIADNLELDVFNHKIYNPITLVDPVVYYNVVDEGGAIFDTITDVINTIGGPYTMMLNKMKDAVTPDSVFVIEFNYIWALIFGIIIVLLLIGYCLDVVIRALTLFIYQVFAPVPIIYYMSPIKKDNEMLSTWLKKVGSCWASLFVRLGVLDFILFFINIILNSSTILSLNENGFILHIIIILGALIFAKKLPKLIEELIPGLKFDGIELNPLKRVKNEALGFDTISGIFNRGIGFATGAAGGFIAGKKAGDDVGDTLRGTVMGTISGASRGFKNKKWSLGDSMNQTYKQMTGNEMKNLSLSTYLLSKDKRGPASVQQTKDLLKMGYAQLNTLNSSLNVSQELSAEIATNLRKHGIDVRDIPKAETELNNRELTASNGLVRLGQDTERLTNEYNASRNHFNETQTNYDLARKNYDIANNSVEETKTSISNIDRQILQKQEQLKSESAAGVWSNTSEEIETLKKQRQGLENKLNTNLADTLRKATDELNTAKSNLDTARSDFDIKSSAYNNHMESINTQQNELNIVKNDKELLSEFKNNIDSENALRKQISDVEKNITTIKDEKSERETYWRVDSSPKEDFDQNAKDIIKRNEAMGLNNNNNNS